MRGRTLGAAVKLLIFALVTVIATAMLGVVISNRTFGPTKGYHAMFTDATDLISGNDVRLAGVRVGTVTSVKVEPTTVNGKTVDQAEVGFTVDKDVPLLPSSRIEIHYLNLVGQRYLAIVEQPSSGTQRQDPNSVIPASRTAPAVDLTALFNGFKPLFQAITPADVNSFALEIVKTLQGEGGTVDGLLTQTASLTNTVANRDAVIGRVVDNLLTVLGTVEKRNAGLNETIVQLQRLVTGLAGDRGTIAASLSHIDQLATSSTSLIAGARPYLPGDLKALTTLARNLNTTKDSDGTNTLNGELAREPAKLNRIIRTATYGGFFNFWLCQLTVAGFPLELGALPGTAPSCPAVSQ